jgi:hypothetical protein
MSCAVSYIESLNDFGLDKCEGLAQLVFGIETAIALDSCTCNKANARDFNEGPARFHCAGEATQS